MLAAKKLVKWFESRARDLPWREDPSPYRVWISEVMLQQTQVQTVIPYFDRFISRFPSVQALATADESDVLLHWSGLGYYSRARNLHAAAKTVVNECGGNFPSSREGWEALPGVGPYTAGAILSIAFGQSEAILDGNVERVFSRFYQVSRETLGEAGYKRELWNYSRQWISCAGAKRLSSSSINQGLMELGALVCNKSAPKALCGICPVSAECGAYQDGRVGEFPEKKKRAKSVLVEETVVALVRRSRALAEVWVSIDCGAVHQNWRRGLFDLPHETQFTSFAAKTEKPSLTVRYVVTNHKVTRQVRVIELNELEKKHPGKLGQLLAKGEWITLASPSKDQRQVPMGASGAKSLQAVAEEWD